MKIRTVILFAGLATASCVAATTSIAAPVSTYTCAAATPCIVETNELGKHRVSLKWSGQGKKYDFYKLTIREHGGGTPEKELRLPGGKTGHIRLDLRKSGDYEIYLAGCEKQKKGAAPVCKPSSEHVRLNLR